MAGSSGAGAHVNPTSTPPGSHADHPNFSFLVRVQGHRHPDFITKVRLAVRKCELRLDDKVILRSEDFGKWTKNSKVVIEIRIAPGAVEFMLPSSKPKKQKTDLSADA